ncbi:glycosyl transferase family 1 [Nostoc linckia z18]|uniref:Glycosyl transferase family 1 n=2 Tax=Nostoc linckia TaxID=92942 RepID=A0A9Q5ZCX1_NOSLI|nr:glycosyltransferase family 4 protein [Nostoc linckia]PHK39120.1 glycosyl transferase family 1 [Nostoc linckia z15]PHK45573.1 glycosyl transferase family 1 [Nostoc linckia z16]PHJ64574.1 glycosyl transferase family 1 [Nostoc linckia z1]PHJ69925.1 glycosyl transferase family 1 [Nostoc linckia z3]PHJ73000.1 glycosyl transferase family 1 [Nostoc linckia z2]
MNKTNPIKIVMLGPSLLQQGGISGYEKLFLEYAPPEVKICHIITHEEGSVVKKITVFLKAIWKFLWILLKQEADIVQLQISQRGSILRQAIMILLAWVFRKPIIIHAHGSQFHLFYDGLPKSIQQLLSWIFGKCQRLIVLSESWKNFYIKNLGLEPEKVVVFYNPVKIPVEVPNRSIPDKVNLLFLGRIGQRKGAFDLIEAISLLPKEHRTKLSLIMAGDGEVEQARNLVTTLNLEDYIKLPGWIGSDERDILLTQANIFVLPSYNEGLPLAMLEAMAWELPVVVTPVGGIPEIVTDLENGFIVNPGNPEELSSSLKSLIENEDLRFSLGFKARKSVFALDIKNHWIAFLKLYHSLLNLDVPVSLKS